MLLPRYNHARTAEPGGSRSAGHGPDEAWTAVIVRLTIYPRNDLENAN